jgi:hypothetical protein
MTTVDPNGAEKVKASALGTAGESQLSPALTTDPDADRATAGADQAADRPVDQARGEKSRSALRR